MSTDLWQDWEVNAGNPKGRFILVFFRLCQYLRRQSWWLLASPILLLYVLVVEWLMGIELGYGLTVGPRLRLYHGTGLVVHPRVTIGDDCILRHGVTLGDRGAEGPVPTLGHRVEIGCGAILLGGITIGDGARIGAGAVVVHDVPAGAVVIGPAARILADPIA